MTNEKRDERRRERAYPDTDKFCAAVHAVYDAWTAADADRAALGDHAESDLDKAMKGLAPFLWTNGERQWPLRTERATPVNAWTDEWDVIMQDDGTFCAEGPRRSTRAEACKDREAAQRVGKAPLSFLAELTSEQRKDLIARAAVAENEGFTRGPSKAQPNIALADAIVANNASTAALIGFVSWVANHPDVSDALTAVERERDFKAKAQAVLGGESQFEPRREYELDQALRRRVICPGGSEFGGKHSCKECKAEWDDGQEMHNATCVLVPRLEGAQLSRQEVVDRINADPSQRYTASIPPESAVTLHVSDDADDAARQAIIHEVATLLGCAENRDVVRAVKARLVPEGAYAEPLKLKPGDNRQQFPCDACGKPIWTGWFRPGIAGAPAPPVKCGACCDPPRAEEPGPAAPNACDPSEKKP